MRPILRSLLVPFVFLLAWDARGQDATTPGEISAPHPTLENVSLEWRISGDDDRDGVVTVRFREPGGSWRTGLPLRRVAAGSNEGFSWENRHAGSLFDLLPGTTYEVELTLDDPDGGAATQTLMVTTRPVPEAPSDATERPVTPSSFASVAESAEPGDVLLLADGTYSGFSLQSDGTRERPIVIRAENRGGAVVDGEVDLNGRKYVFLEGLTVNDRIRMNSSVGMVVRECTVNTSGSGIVAQGDGTEDSYICDNRVIGVTPFEDAALGANGANTGEGIQLAGAGSVVCYNYVQGFRDAISTMEDSEAVDQQSIDIYNNDINIGADDAIEVDFTMGNVRVMRNRIRNSFVGLSGQPTLGGPLYFIRNVMHNVVYSPFKLHRGSVGDVGFHNTVVKSGDAFACYAGVTWSEAWFRNNLFIGGDGGGEYGGYGNGSGRVAQLADADTTCDFNFDGYGSIGTGSFSGRIGSASFASLAELRSSTTESDAVEVDMDVFAADVTFPADGPFPALEVEDLRLRDGSAAVDRGTPLANVNDGHAGDAPDLGAYEAGSLLPHYGPRWDGPTEQCGNGVREGAESCDDGNQADGDGCSSDCELDLGAGGESGTDGGNPSGSGGDGSGGSNGSSGGAQSGSGGGGATGFSGSGAGGGANGTNATNGNGSSGRGSTTGAGAGGDGKGDDGGCACRAGNLGSGLSGWPWFVLGGLALALGSRRRGRAPWAAPAG